MVDREPGVMLWTAETVAHNDRELQSWLAEYGDAVGIGTTRADALRSLADDLDRREQQADCERERNDPSPAVIRDLGRQHRGEQ